MVALMTSKFYLADQHRRDVHNWLAAPSPQSNYETSRKAREAGTGSWFIEGTQYQDWKSNSGSLLWVTGGRKYFDNLLKADADHLHRKLAVEKVYYRAYEVA